MKLQIKYKVAESTSDARCVVHTELREIMLLCLLVQGL